MTVALYQAGVTVFALDLVGWLVWFFCGCFMMGFGCWDFILSHVVVGVHFIGQTSLLAMVIDQYRDGTVEPDDQGGSTRERILPKRFPISWGVVSLFALAGDVFLLANDAHNYQTLTPTTECSRMLKVELFIESFITLSAVLSIIWYVALVIEREVNRAEHLVATKNK